MIARPLRLPYPEFSWGFTQHLGKVLPRETLFPLLEAAHRYSSHPNYRDEITTELLARNVLPANRRADVGGRPQIWRDYQQVLSELGLIVSTRRGGGDGVTITPVGLMWLDGLIGYSELITTQALRYQYPNGHRQDNSDEVIAALTAAGVRIPPTRTQLDAASGVLIKPAVLILRVLLELLRGGDANPRMTTRECLSALVPIRTNADWEQALAALRSIRRDGLPADDLTQRRLRHVQEWFRLLNATDLFVVSTTGIRLSPVALQNLDALTEVCEYHENPTTFWIPQSHDRWEMARSWFDFYGTPNLQSQWLIPESERSAEYVDENYPSGEEEGEDAYDVQAIREWGYAINPQPFFDDQLRPVAPQTVGEIQGPTPEEIAARAEVARLRRERSTLLHEQIVRLVAERLHGMGYEVQDDPLSVDLVARRNDEEAIIEVKTVTPRNLPNRIRLGVGQLSEYRFRWHYQEGTRPDGLLVLSSSTTFPDWFIRYFEDDLHLGLASLASSDTFRAHTAGEIERLLTV